MNFDESSMVNQHLTDKINVDFGGTVVAMTYEELIVNLLKRYENENMSIKLEKVLNSLNENELKKLLQFLLDVNMSKCFTELNDELLENLNTKYPEMNIVLLKEIKDENFSNENNPCPKMMKSIKEETIESELALERVAREVYKSEIVPNLRWSHMKKVNEVLSGDSFEEITALGNVLVASRFFNSDLSFAIKNGQAEEIDEMWMRVFKNIFIDGLKNNTDSGPQPRIYIQGIPLLSGVHELVSKTPNDKELYDLLKEGFHTLINTYKVGNMTPGQEGVIQMLIEILVINKDFYQEPQFIGLSEMYIQKQDDGILIIGELLNGLYNAHKWNNALAWGAVEKWDVNNSNMNTLTPKDLRKIKQEMVQVLREAYPQYSMSILVENNLVKMPKELLENSLSDDIISIFKQLVANGCPESVPSGIEKIITQTFMKNDIQQKNVSSVHQIKKF